MLVLIQTKMCMKIQLVFALVAQNFVFYTSNSFAIHPYHMQATDFVPLTKR